MQEEEGRPGATAEHGRGAEMQCKEQGVQAQTGPRRLLLGEGTEHRITTIFTFFYFVFYNVDNILVQ